MKGRTRIRSLLWADCTDHAFPQSKLSLELHVIPGEKWRDTKVGLIEVAVQNQSQVQAQPGNAWRNWVEGTASCYLLSPPSTRQHQSCLPWGCRVSFCSPFTLSRYAYLPILFIYLYVPEVASFQTLISSVLLVSIFLTFMDNLLYYFFKHIQCA